MNCTVKGAVPDTGSAAALAVGRDGSVTVAEAPQHDCDFETVRTHTGLAAIQANHQQAWGHPLEVLDLRREAVTYRDGIIVERRSLPGDPRGYRTVDLGARSCFHGAGFDPRRFRGADYDATPTTEHHRAGRHEYLLSETVLSADLVVNLPKIKTHKKTGVTLAIKNLVGINGDKNWLPHHCVGSVSEGGDEYPGHAWIDRARSRATELARRMLRRGVGTAALRAARRLENAARGDDFVRSGNWYGNRTTWRMCIDLARCVLYTDARGAHLDAQQPIRQLLTVADGIVAGEGEGPLAPSDRPLGAVLAGLDPIALDLAALRLMGFDEARIPKVAEAMRARELPITQVRRPEQVVVFEATPSSSERKRLELCDLAPETPFRAHSGWRGHVENRSCAGPDAA